jgi:parallel beta-helix repeat protein
MIFEGNSEIYIIGNNITDNNDIGINMYTLVFCHKYIINNNIDNNGNGIYLGYMGWNNIITGNKITHHDGYGIYTAPESSNTTAFHNEFYGNDDNVIGNGGTSGSWDDNYPSGGNYWDDYTGIDQYHGENQDIPGGDGIGDTPYQITGSYVDNYPFMAPFGMKKISELQEQWNLISLPFNATVDKTLLQYYYNGSFFPWDKSTTNENPTGQPLISPYYFDWDRINQTYQFKSTLDKGYGYWLFAFQPGTFWIEEQNYTIDNSITTLSPGWNLISIPCDCSVNKNEIIVNNTEWDLAVSNGWISNFVFGWNRTGQNYEFCESFEPGKSYWLFATQNCKLNL